MRPSYFPAEVFTTYRRAGISRVICEDKHKGGLRCIIRSMGAAQFIGRVTDPSTTP